MRGIVRRKLKRKVVRKGYMSETKIQDKYMNLVLRLCRLCIVIFFIYSKHLHPFFIVKISLTIGK